MGTTVSVSQSQLARRRRQLRRERRVKNFQAGWQLLAVSALAGGLVWATTLPGWVIHKPAQIKIEGNAFLSDRAIRSLVSLSYPESLLQVSPQDLATALESNGPILKATVNRQLFPPGLTITVKERYPVAIASSGNSAAVAALSPSETVPPGSAVESLSSSQSVGLLDEQGVWMPLENYTSLQETLQMPTLTVIGNPEQYRPYWPRLYRAIRRTSVKIYEIDWQDPANLILKTELGVVHLGPYTSRFPNQLDVLAQMRQLPKHINSSQIAYIDLKNPQSPSLQTIGAKTPRQPNTP